MFQTKANKKQNQQTCVQTLWSVTNREALPKWSGRLCSAWETSPKPHYVREQWHSWRDSCAPRVAIVTLGTILFWATQLDRDFPDCVSFSHVAGRSFSARLCCPPPICTEHSAYGGWVGRSNCFFKGVGPLQIGKHFLSGVGGPAAPGKPHPGSPTIVGHVRGQWRSCRDSRAPRVAFVTLGTILFWAA